MKYDGLHQLIQFIDFYGEEDIYDDLALNLLKHHNEIPFLTITELSELCYVSPATLSRFVKRLGFASYADFRLSFKTQYFLENDYEALQLDNPDVTMKQKTMEFTQHLSHNFQKLENTLNLEQLDEIAMRIHDASSVSFYSQNIHQQIAADFQTRLAKLGKLSFAFNDIDQQIIHAQNIKPRSVSIFISMRGRTLKYKESLLKELKGRESYIVIISQDSSEPLHMYADEVVVLPGNDSIETGRIMLIYYLDCILIQYHHHYYDEIQQEHRKRIQNIETSESHFLK